MSKPGTRLPRIGAALILETVWLETFRDGHGMAECLAHGLGAMRQKLGPPPIKPIRFVPPMAKEEVELTLNEEVEIARDEARVLLAGMCNVCPFQKCKMKAWGRID